MQVKVRFLDNLRLEARFDDFQVITDQPIRYKGDGSAPGPFDYFLASSALCAAYFVKVYCNTRGIPTHDIHITQDNVVDPNNRYRQTFVIRATLPANISAKDRKGIVASMERCTVKRVIQNDLAFQVETVEAGQTEAGLDYTSDSSGKTMIVGKDVALEETIENLTNALAALGIKIEIASWRNIVPHVWSVHIRDADSPICFSNGKGATKDAALCSALGEYIERLATHYFYSDYYLGPATDNGPYVHDPQERWFEVEADDRLPEGLMDEHFLNVFNSHGDLRASHLIDLNSGQNERGICALPYIRQSDQATVYVPVNLIGNMYVSNGMSAGNTREETRVQALSEIFERAVKNQILAQEIALPSVPEHVLTRYPNLQEGMAKLESQGFPVFAKDASLGGQYPVMAMVLLNPNTGGIFASFGAHPKFEVALERVLTELMQGRSFEGLNDIPMATLNTQAVQEHTNLVEHFIDSSGVVSWKILDEQTDHPFVDWNVPGDTQQEYQYLMDLLKAMGNEVYIADYEDLGAHVCRVLVPGYSEIYQPDDLLWDNVNRGAWFRSDILNVHQLNDDQLGQLLTRLEEAQLDDYLLVGELMGIAFDENSVWGRCTVGELKALIALALKDFETAKHYVDLLLHFNDNVASRKKFYQLLHLGLATALRQDVAWKNLKSAFEKMYGPDLTAQIEQCMKGDLRFPGLEPIQDALGNLTKHQELLDSYRKILNKNRSTSAH